jgi:hypothetical protein
LNPGDIKNWETVKYLIDNGFYFDHIYDYENKKMAKYPENIKDAKIFVKKYDEQKIEIFKIFDIVNKNQNIMDIDNEIVIIRKIMYRIQLWQIVNEKEKFKKILEQIKKYHQNNISKEYNNNKLRKEYNGFIKWL